MDNPDNMEVEIQIDSLDMDLIASMAKESDTISPPQLGRLRKISYSRAEAALRNLAEKNLLQLLPESGTVPVYRLTCSAYVMIDEHRNCRGILSRCFVRRTNAGLRKGLFDIDAILTVAAAELSLASPDVANARAAIAEARDKILDLVQTSVEADQV
jgi:ribosomal protein S25